MKVLKKGKSADGTDIQIEDWSELYSYGYGSVLAFYKKSKKSHEGSFAPKEGKEYRFSFDFPNNEEAEWAFIELESGLKQFSDFLNYFAGNPKYKDCI